MLDDRDRYHPRTIEELAADPIPVTLINEPLPPDNVSTLGRPNKDRCTPSWRRTWLMLKA